MDRTAVMQEIRKMRFEETWNEWKKGRLTQEEAGRILGMSERTFRRYVRRVEERGNEGLLDKRLAQASARRAPVDEALALVEKYRKRHDGWNVKHFHSWYKREGGTRSYTWVKAVLQKSGAVPEGPWEGKAPEETGASALGRDDDPSGCQPSSLGPRTDLGSGGDDG